MTKIDKIDKIGGVIRITYLSLTHANSRVYNKSKVEQRMFWEKPKEVQFQQPEAVLSICHRGCPAINEKKFKVKHPKNHKSFSFKVGGIQ